MKCALISFFNSSNIGDCVLSNCLEKKVSKIADVEKISFSLNPFEFTDLDNIKEVTLVNDSKKKDKIIDVISKLHLNAFLYFYYLHKKFHNEIENKKIIQIISDCDFVVIGGGNMVFDLNDKTLSAARLLYYVKLIKKLNKKIFICSIGIGPFSNNYQLKKCIDSLNYSDYLSFRDKTSLDLYENSKYTKKNKGLLSIDPAFNLNISIQSTRLTKIIGLNVIDPTLFCSNELVGLIKENYIHLISKILNETDYSVRIFTSELRDIKFAKLICDTLSNDRVSLCKITGFNSLIENYSDFSIIIGSRMHSMIIGLTQNIPIIGLSWQQKVTALFSMLELTDYCYDIYSIKYDKLITQIRELRKYQIMLKNTRKIISKRINVDNEILMEIQNGVMLDE